MKRISILFLLLFVFYSNALNAQYKPKQPTSKTSHFIFAEALAVNYTFHQQFLNDRIRLGFGLTGGYGIRFPLIKTTFNMNFENGEGTYSLAAFQDIYTEMLKLQLIYGYYLSENFILQVSPYVSTGYFGDFSNTLNFGVETAIFYSHNWFVSGLRIQTGYYTFDEYSFYPVFLTPTIGFRF
jgi:hypothetical protein